MNLIELVLTMLLMVVASGYLVRVLPLALPLPLVQVGLGAVVAGVFNHGVTLEPDIFFLLFLPPLLFLDGWRIPKDGLLRDRGQILQLAVGLVAFTVLSMGFLIHWMIPAMPLAVAFALAAVVSPTDPVAVSSIAARLPMPRRLMHILEGESLLNDATALVCFQFAVAAAISGTFSLASASTTFVWLSVTGVSVGILFTGAISFLQSGLSRKVGEENGSPILISLLVPFGAYLIAERADASGILAAVAAGITMNYVELSGRALATTRVQRAAVWDTVQFALNGIMFVLLGEQMPGILQSAIASVALSGHHDPWWLPGIALAINVGLTSLRFIWVWASLWLPWLWSRLQGESVVKPQWRLVLAMTLAGVRGSITLAGVLTLPLLMPDATAFPARELAVFLAASVILTSLLLASIALPKLLKGLQLPSEPVLQQKEDCARQAATTKAIAAIEKAQHKLAEGATVADMAICTEAAAHLTAYYLRRLRGDINSDSEASQLRKADQAVSVLHLAALEAERAEIFRLARHFQISDETSRKLVRELDLTEARYR